jgi:hypothetical protein
LGCFHNFIWFLVELEAGLVLEFQLELVPVLVPVPGRQAPLLLGLAGLLVFPDWLVFLYEPHEFFWHQ